jgi:hypothetical protein
MLDFLDHKLADNSYIQLNSIDLINYARNKKYINIIYNEWGDFITNNTKYIDYAEIFTLNPSTKIDKNLVNNFKGKNKKILAVLGDGDVKEIHRLYSIGVRDIFVRNGFLVNREKFDFYKPGSSTKCNVE